MSTETYDELIKDIETNAAKYGFEDSAKEYISLLGRGKVLYKEGNKMLAKSREIKFDMTESIYNHKFQSALL